MTKKEVMVLQMRALCMQVKALRRRRRLGWYAGNSYVAKRKMCESTYKGGSNEACN